MLSDIELAQQLEREYYAMLEANSQAEDKGQPTPNELGTMREFLHGRGFSFKWLTQHGYTDTP